MVRRIINIRDIGTLVISTVVFTSIYSFFSTIQAAQPSLLAEKHKIAGITCEDCHKESPPKDQVSTAVCNKCHGDQAKLAERTQKVIPNPHKSHLGNVKCELCHHAHKAPEDYCSTCHDFSYKVP